MSYSSVKIRPADWKFLDVIKEVTRLSKAEILSQALVSYFDRIPDAQKNEIKLIIEEKANNGCR